MLKRFFSKNSKFLDHFFSILRYYEISDFSKLNKNPKISNKINSKNISNIWKMQILWSLKFWDPFLKFWKFWEHFSQFCDIVKFFEIKKSENFEKNKIFRTKKKISLKKWSNFGSYYVGRFCVANISAGRKKPLLPSVCYFYWLNVSFYSFDYDVVKYWHLKSEVKYLFILIIRMLKKK